VRVKISRFILKRTTILSGEIYLTSVKGVKFCESAVDVNRWISENPDKKVIDVKFSSAYDSRYEEIRYSCLILYKDK